MGKLSFEIMCQEGTKLEPNAEKGMLNVKAGMILFFFELMLHSCHVSYLITRRLYIRIVFCYENKTVIHSMLTRKNINTNIKTKEQ